VAHPAVLGGHGRAAGRGRRLGSGGCGAAHVLWRRRRRGAARGEQGGREERRDRHGVMRGCAIAK
jgi:hypothetical protein